MVLRASVLLTMLALTGCDEPLTLAQVCKETPGFCSDLNKDSHCKNERSVVILKRYTEYKKPTDENKYQLLKGFESYNQCITLAAKIEHKKLKSKTTSRIEGQLTSIKEMTRLYQDTQKTNHPGLLYYHWSRNSDQSALNKLLALENDKSVTQSAEMQFFLASYYIHAYIFSKVAQMSGIENIDLLPIEHQLMSNGKNLDSLDTLAQQTYEQIQSGEFVSPREF